MIHETYQTEIEKLKAEEKRWKQRSNAYLWGKLLFFAGAALCAYLSFTEAATLYIIGTIIGFAAYVALYKIERGIAFLFIEEYVEATLPLTLSVILRNVETKTIL